MTSFDSHSRAGDALRSAAKAMTERAEERESLARIEDRVNTYRGYEFGDTQGGFAFDEELALADLRTLINEVKERDSREEWLCVKCRTIWPRSSIRPGVKCVICPDDSCQGDTGTRDGMLLREAEAEVKELRERVATAEGSWKNAVDERAQMEEALREMRDWAQLAAFHLANGRPGSVTDPVFAIHKADAALSPSDTEEEA